MARGRTSKATKKFESKHLKRVIDERRIRKKNKDKYNNKKKKKGVIKALDSEKPENEEKPLQNDKKTTFDGMTIDEFLETGGDDGGPSLPDTSVLAKSHKVALEGLKEKDPSFYEYLKENDRELLEFDPDELVDDEDDEDGHVEGGLTVEILAKWEKLLVEQKSLSALKKILIAVKQAAANLTDETQGGNEKYILTDPEAFDRLLLIAFQQTPTVLQHHVPVVDKQGKPTVQAQGKALSQIVPLLKSLFHSTVVLLSNLSSPPTTLLVLSQTEKLIPYITGFRKLIKQLITAILDIWARTLNTPDEDEEEEEKQKAEEQDTIKIAAFLWIRKVMLVGDNTLKDLCLKTSYGAFVKNARVTTSRTLPHLNFMKNSLSELYGFNQQISYQHAFTYIRQLAINLRNAIATKTPETTRIVYCWQYFHSLDFFSRMLSQHVGSNKSSPLEPLVYPVIQIALGAIKLNPSSQYFPLRFHLVTALLRLSKHTGVYIPLAPSLLEPLESALLKSTFSKKASSSAGGDKILKPIEFEYTLRVSSSYLSGPSGKLYRDQVGLKLVELLGQFFDLYTLSPAFPELIVPCVVVMKKWLKRYGGECGPKVRHGLNGLVERLEEQGKWVEEGRKGLTFDPEKLAGMQIARNADDAPLRKWVKRHQGMSSL